METITFYRRSGTKHPHDAGAVPERRYAYHTACHRSKRTALCAVFFDGMVNSLAINQSLVRPILRCEQPRLSADILAAAVLQADECRVETDMNKVFAAFLYGDAIVLD